MEDQTATPTPAPVASPEAPAAALTPARAASYDSARRNKLTEWANSSGEDEVFELPDDVAVTPPPTEVKEEVQAAPDATAPTPVEGAVVIPEPAVKEPDATPTPTTEAAAPTPPTAPQPSKHSFSAKAGETEWSPPENLSFSYRADGRDVTRPLAEVIQLAKLGENYDRRSREAAEQQKRGSEELAEFRQKAEQELSAGWNEVWETVRRFAKDPEYREEFLTEFERLESNPAEVELRVKAKRADELEKQFQEQQKISAAEWNRQVWRTVDGIIAEQVKGEYPYANPDRVRQRFHEAFRKNGKTVLNQSFVKDLIKADHDSIAEVVQRERTAALAEKDKEIQKIRTETAVETRNKIVDQALHREQTARVVPSGTVTPAEKVAAPIKTATEASKRLKEWANS